MGARHVTQRWVRRGEGAAGVSIPARRWRAPCSLSTWQLALTPFRSPKNPRLCLGKRVGRGKTFLNQDWGREKTGRFLHFLDI